MEEARGVLENNEVDAGKTKDIAHKVEEVWLAGWKKDH